MKKMIINADDFGLCAGVNDAVAEAHTKGVLTSATIMANMAGFDKAVKIVKMMPSLGVGVHLNLTEGVPLSKDPEVKILQDSKGQFKYSPAKLAVKSIFNLRIQKAIESELSAQIEAVFNSGIKPTHLDSHKHFHCFGQIYKIVCGLAEKFCIKAIRWPWEPETVCSEGWPEVTRKDRIRALMVRQMALKCQNIDERFIKTDIFFGLAHTGKIDDNFWTEIGAAQFEGIAEVMTHPGYKEGLENTRLVGEREIELKWLCEPMTKEILKEAEIELINYGDLK